MGCSANIKASKPLKEGIRQKENSSFEACKNHVKIEPPLKLQYHIQYIHQTEP